MLTKPAGCFLQVLSVPLMMAGCVYTVSGPRSEDGFSSIIGIVLILTGITLFVTGGKSARQHSADAQRRKD